MFSKKYIALVLLLSFSFIALKTYATVVVPKILGNGMVLQRNKPVAIWGTAAAGENITVKFSNQVKKTTADTSGKWLVMLDPMQASATPQTLEISGTNTIKLTDILVGEVWLCSGQSNMSYEMRKNSKVRRPDTTTVNTPIDELERAHNPQIRIFLATQHNLRMPDSTHSGWDVAEGKALSNFSAAGYFFAKNLNHDLHVPVGIICSAISGSRIEPWMPTEAFDAIPYFKQNNVKIDGDPGKLYIHMIAPVAPYTLRGFLWYQGESGAYLGETIIYTYKMNALINWWRNLWGDKNLPFYYVQIAPFYYSKAKSNVTYSIYTEPEFREAQTAALKIPHTGMIVTTDLNDSLTNIHPAFKWEVGRRLELQALANTYGKKDVVFSGPMYKQMHIDGNKIILDFNYVGKGLENHDGKPLDYFTIAGANGNFVNANAVIKGDKVIVSSPSVKSPVAVRFGWTEVAEPNLFNKNGLPAVPFRTDNPLKFTPTE